MLDKYSSIFLIEIYQRMVTVMVLSSGFLDYAVDLISFSLLNRYSCNFSTLPLMPQFIYSFQPRTNRVPRPLSATYEHAQFALWIFRFAAHKSS